MNRLRYEPLAKWKISLDHIRCNGTSEGILITGFLAFSDEELRFRHFESQALMELPLGHAVLVFLYEFPFAHFPFAYPRNAA